MRGKKTTVSTRCIRNDFQILLVSFFLRLWKDYCKVFECTAHMVLQANLQTCAEHVRNMTNIETCWLKHANHVVILPAFCGSGFCTKNPEQVDSSTFHTRRTHSQTIPNLLSNDPITSTTNRTKNENRLK